MQISSLNSNKPQESSKLKKYILIGLIGAIVLLILLLLLLVMYTYMQPQNLSLKINGQSYNYSQDTFIFENDKIYVSLKDIANSIDYRYYEGGYKEFTQDKTKCYLQSKDEIVVYKLGTNKIYKTLNDANIKYSELEIDESVKSYNNKLYVIISALGKGCNANIVYDKAKNEISINTLSNLYEVYNNKAIAGDYSNVSAIDETFNNQKAILNKMLVVKDSTNNNSKYGVISLDGTQTYLDVKYDEIDFVETLGQFIVKGDKKYGVVMQDGTQIIKLEYDKISILDSINNLYYAEKNGKKGVLTQDGKTLGNLYVEYDELGINSTLFPNQDIEDSKLLYDTCIPVKKEDKWELFNIEGELISKSSWDSLGYVEDKNTRNNILLIKDFEGIIVSKNGKYGIIDSKGELLAPCIFDKIYSQVVAGEEKYYLQLENSAEELGSYINRINKNSTQQSKNNKTK